MNNYFFYVRELKGFAEKDTPPVPQIPLFRHTLSTAIYCPIYCLLLPLLSHFVSFVTYRTGTEIVTHNPPAVTSTTKPLTGSKPTDIVKIIYVLYNSTTQIYVYWYVRGKHFDFWQATTEQGKPGYFTTVRYAVSLRAKGNAKGNGVPY